MPTVFKAALMYLTVRGGQEKAFDLSQTLLISAK